MMSEVIAAAQQWIALTEQRARTISDFAQSTKIEVPNGNEVAYVPFSLWDAQAETYDQMAREQLIVILKARQLGISWLACLYIMRLCSLYPGQPALCLSRGQLEANELVHRISFLYHQHANNSAFSRLVDDNTADLAWENGSSVISLAATKNAGRSLTAAVALLDEWAFMAWPRQTLAAVKPTIDAGGKLFIISSADGQGSAYHQFWQHAVSGNNGYKAIFLPWFAHPDRGPDWRDQKLVEASGDTASVLREYPANDIEAFTAAAGLVYDVWSDGPPDGNVTEDAEYDPQGGPVVLAIDDGYAGLLDQQTGRFTADSHPRAVLFCQLRDDGRICIFEESYRVRTLSDQHIESVLAAGYPDPDYAVVDSAAAELRGRLASYGIGTYGKPQNVEESIKEARRMIAPDVNGWRRILVHPRCDHLRFELASYRRDDKGNPIAQHDHGVSALRYLAYRMRYE